MREESQVVKKSFLISRNDFFPIIFILPIEVEEMNFFFTNCQFYTYTKHAYLK